MFQPSANYKEKYNIIVDVNNTNTLVGGLDYCPLVSILVPVYNVEGCIERCARSVFEQTYRNLEFLFVDDGCTDRSINILERVIKDYPHLRERIRLIHHETNKGLSASRNTLVFNSTGEFVYHVDSDDWLELFAIEKLIRKQREIDADIVVGKWDVYFPNGVVFKDNKTGCELEPSKYIEASLSMNVSCTIWSRLTRKSLYVDNLIRWDEKIWREDYSVLMKVYYFAKSTSYVDEVVYHYDRRRETSIMNMENKDITLYSQAFCYESNIITFFSNKEPLLSKKALGYRIIKRHNMLRDSLYRGNKDAFRFILMKIEKETDRSLWHLIGWDDPCIHFIESHYCVGRIKSICGQVKRALLSYIHSHCCF